MLTTTWLVQVMRPPPPTFAHFRVFRKMCRRGPDFKVVCDFLCKCADGGKADRRREMCQRVEGGTHKKVEQDNYLFQSNYWLPGKGGTDFALFVDFSPAALRAASIFVIFSPAALRAASIFTIFSPAALRAASKIKGFLNDR